MWMLDTTSYVLHNLQGHLDFPFGTSLCESWVVETLAAVYWERAYKSPSNFPWLILIRPDRSLVPCIRLLDGFASCMKLSIFIDFWHMGFSNAVMLMAKRGLGSFAKVAPPVTGWESCGSKCLNWTFCRIRSIEVARWGRNEFILTLTNDTTVFWARGTLELQCT